MVITLTKGLKRILKSINRSSPINGIIAFHDIVPNSFSRTGIKTSSYDGEVPKVLERNQKNYEHKEFIESDNQDGCGFGIIYFDQT